MIVDLVLIPNNWYLYRFADLRTGHTYADDVAVHLYYQCELQHIKGGRLTIGTGSTPQAAVDEAIKQVQFKWPDLA